MKKNRIKIVLGILLALGLTLNVSAQENKKLAQTGFQFLSVVSDARGASMAEAMTSLQIGSSALFFNPAGMAQMSSYIDVSASTNKWIADISHSTVSVALNPWDGKYGVIGLSAQFVDYGDFYGTRVNKASAKGYDDTGIFNLTSMAVGIGYANQISDRFSIGGQIRWVRQSLGESVIPVITKTDTTEEKVTNKLTPLVFDFGTQFKTGIKSIVFGMSIRNFSSEVKYAEEGFQTPLTFTLGISMNALDLIGDLPFNQALLVSIDASHYRDKPEQVKVGLDYRFLEMFSIRGGYVSNNDESKFSFGLGVTKFGLSFDYAYTPFGIFDNVQRFTVRFVL